MQLSGLHRNSVVVVEGTVPGTVPYAAWLFTQGYCRGCRRGQSPGLSLMQLGGLLRNSVVVVEGTVPGTVPYAAW